MSTTLLILFLISIAAALYGSSAGGGSLLILPTLIFLGIDPHTAVASSLFGYIGMCIVGMKKFHDAKKIDWRIGCEGAIAAVIGALFGAFLFPSFEAGFLRKGIGIALIVMLIVILVGRKGIERGACRRSHELIGLALLVVVGFYAVTISAGASILATYVLVFFFGRTFLESAGINGILFIGTNVLATAINVSGGLVDWSLGLTMLAGISTGSWIGIHYALRSGDRLVRMILVPVVVFSAAKMLF